MIHRTLLVGDQALARDQETSGYPYDVIGDWRMTPTSIAPNPMEAYVVRRRAFGHFWSLPGTLTLTSHYRAV